MEDRLRINIPMLPFSNWSPVPTPHPLSEGVDDPGILKCVFMAGGPGSGKSYLAGDLFGVQPKLRASFSSYGLKLINSDSMFEVLLRKQGIDPKDLAVLYRDPNRWSSIMVLRDRAKEITMGRQQQYERGRLGLIIDGTGDNSAKIIKKQHRASVLGYDCFMVFVNTRLATALRRNEQRDRTLPPEIVKQMWLDVQGNLGAYQQLFGNSRLLIVDNDDGAGTTAAIRSQIRQWMQRPVENRLGREWIRVAGGIYTTR